MADKKIKVRCSICGDSVAVEGTHIAEHNHRYTGAKVICYGSHMPVFLDRRGNGQAGEIMYINHGAPVWDDDAEFLADLADENGN